MVEDVAGKDAVKYFPPGIMTLFMFIVTANFLGLIPMSFTSTSHIAVTAILAGIVFFFVTILASSRTVPVSWACSGCPPRRCRCARSWRSSS